MLLVIFVVGYVFIALEHKIGLNKAATALITGVLAWTVVCIEVPDRHFVEEALMKNMAETSAILFFLLGAMVVVELIDAHDGFELVMRRIRSRSRRQLFWSMALATFVLSAVLDNLTTTVMMVSLARKLVADRKERWTYIGLVVIAANAGGAWSPIGDVTSTMLWIGGQVTAGGLIKSVFLPSVVCTFVPVAIAAWRAQGDLPQLPPSKGRTHISHAARNTIFFSGIGVLMLIPVFTLNTGLPPFMGMLLGLGLLWVISELIHRQRDTEDRDVLSVTYALRKIDATSILFFLGILLAVGALETSGDLARLSGKLTAAIADPHHIAVVMGVASALIDNVPLVAGCMAMYDLSTFPVDDSFWHLLAYTTGTGGSALIIGTAAGIAAMGMEDIPFGWYLKRISLYALIGFGAGIAVYWLCRV